MKRIPIAIALTLTTLTFTIQAQDMGAGPPPNECGPQGGPGGDHQRPKPPLDVALDANGDGVIDSTEIANAPAALKQLDKNGDGMLTQDEVRPPRPPRDGGPGPEQSSGGGDQKSARPDQDPPQGGPRGGHQPPKPPMEEVLDANADGVIDAGEIANAAKALKKLDKNGDGKLSQDEVRPPCPPRDDE